MTAETVKCPVCDHEHQCTMPAFYEITAADVGRVRIRAFGKDWSVVDFLGRIYPQDVGKRVYRTLNNAGDHYILQVENHDQRARRLAGGGS